MITIQHREPSGELTKYVKKISIFDSKEKIKYKLFKNIKLQLKEDFCI